jgi:hypothetical protein
MGQFPTTEIGSIALPQTIAVECVSCLSQFSVALRHLGGAFSLSRWNRQVSTVHRENHCISDKLLMGCLL